MKKRINGEEWEGAGQIGINTNLGLKQFAQLKDQIR